MFNVHIDSSSDLSESRLPRLIGKQTVFDKKADVLFVMYNTFYARCDNKVGMKTPHGKH